MLKTDINPMNLVKTFLSDKQLYQYIVAGGLSAIVDLGGFLALNFFLNTHYLINATISFFLATLVNYLLCTVLVFNQPSKYNRNTKFMLTYLVSGIGLAIHHSLLWSFVEYIALPMALAKILAMGIAFFWNYLSRKHWVFAKAHFGI